MAIQTLDISQKDSITLKKNNNKETFMNSYRHSHTKNPLCKKNL